MIQPYFSVATTGVKFCEVFAKAQVGMNTVTSWLNKNLLTLNVDKTTYITFAIKTNDKPDLSLTIVSHSCPNVNDTSCQCPNLKNTESTKAALAQLLTEILNSTIILISYRRECVD